MQRGVPLALILLAACTVVALWMLLDPRLPAVAARLDRDSDGHLERSEVGPVAARRFDAIDRDGSDTVDGGEFRRWILGQWWQGRTAAVEVPELPARPDAEVLRRWIEAPVARGELDGVGLLILRGGEVVFRQVAGDLVADEAVPLGAATAWLTGATFACLGDRGLLDLDAPVDAAAAGLSSRWSGVTLAQLLSHRVGAPADDLSMLDPALSNRAAARMVADAFPPDPSDTEFRPGEASLLVAVALAESLTGRPWRRLFVECLAWPLSLTTAAWGHPVAGPSRRGLAMPGSGLYLSLDDYGAFLSMLQQQGRYDAVPNLSEDAVRWLLRDRIADLPRASLPSGAEALGHAIGAWCEAADANGNCTQLVRPGSHGALAWLDRERSLAGILMSVDAQGRVAAWNHATRELATEVFSRPEESSATGPADRR